MPTLEPLFEGLDRSVLLRVTTVHAGSLWLRGRLALCTPGSDSSKLVAHAIKKLPSVDNPRVEVYGPLLAAGVAAKAGDASTAVAKLREAWRRGEELQLQLHAAAARRQLGVLLGGTEGAEHVEAADRVLSGEGVTAPERFASWFVPGVHP